MAEQLSEHAVYSQGITTLTDKLGPVETLRFLALVSRQKFDYQQWRIQNLGGKSLDEIVSQAELTESQQ